ncbi:MAG: hypothetical protein ACQESR_23430 [Planctomycetota bacterium]
MESRPTQAVLPLVGLAAEKVIRDRYICNLVEYNTSRLRDFGLLYTTILLFRATCSNSTVPMAR